MAKPGMSDVFELYQQKVALLSSAQKEKLCAAHDEGMEPFVIGCAILRAKQEQRRSRLLGKDKHISFNYINRIIQDWLNHGITSEDEFKSYWAAQSEERGRSEHVQTEEKVRREDFTYTKPVQDRTLFTFLDDQ